MTSRFISVVVLVVSCLYLVSCIQEATVIDVRAQIRELILLEPLENNRTANDQQFLGGLVRLSFHDCVGERCDGCINHDNPENAGLAVYTDRLDILFNTLEVDDEAVDMSRADFWALAGIEAATLAAEHANSPVPEIIFRSGREDCPTSPVTTETHDFPSALGNTSHVLEFFDEQFGFDEKEATAILGAHTLGRAHRQASGFIHPWVARKNRLDNAFYSDLNDTGKGWHQRNISTGRGDENTIWFWENSEQPLQLMLNADMALLKDFTAVDETGKVDCTYSTCPFSAGTVDWVQAFAADNDLWVAEFSKAFQKMIESGWEGQLQPVEVATTTTTADPTTTSTPTTTTTAIASTTPGALPNVTSACSNNKIRNPNFNSLAGYKKAKKLTRTTTDPAFGSSMGSYQCTGNKRHKGSFQLIKFDKGDHVRSFTASLWSKLEVAEPEAAASGKYSLFVKFKLQGVKGFEKKVAKFDPTNSEFHRRVITYSGEKDIRRMWVWMQCADQGRVAYFDELALLVNPDHCLLP